MEEYYLPLIDLDNDEFVVPASKIFLQEASGGDKQDKAWYVYLMNPNSDPIRWCVSEETYTAVKNFLTGQHDTSDQ